MIVNLNLTEWHINNLCKLNEKELWIEIYKKSNMIVH